MTTNEILTRAAEVLERSVTLENQTLAAELRRFDTAQREALARVEAEKAEVRLAFGGQQMTLDECQAHLAEAVGLLREVNSQRFTTAATVEIIESFIGRHSQTFHDHAQAEQQEASEPSAAEAIDSLTHPLCVISLRCDDRQKELATDLAKIINRHNNVDEEAQGAQAGDEPKIPPMGKLDIPVSGVPLNECHSCGWLGGENEVPGEDDQCYCPNCHSDNIDDDVNLPRLFHLVRYLARAALATQPAAGEPVATLMRRRSIGGPSVGVVRFDASRLPEGDLVDVYLAPPVAAHGDEAVQIKLPDLIRCSDEMHERGEKAVERAIKDQCFDRRTQFKVYFEAAIGEWFSQQKAEAQRAQAGEGGEV